MGRWHTGRAVIRPPKGMAAFTGCEQRKATSVAAGCQGGVVMSFGMWRPSFWIGLGVRFAPRRPRRLLSPGFGLFLLTIYARFVFDIL